MEGLKEKEQEKVVESSGNKTTHTWSDRHNTVVDRTEGRVREVSRSLKRALDGSTKRPSHPPIPSHPIPPSIPFVSAKQGPSLSMDTDGSRVRHT